MTVNFVEKLADNLVSKLSFSMVDIGNVSCYRKGLVMINSGIVTSRGVSLLIIKGLCWFDNCLLCIIKVVIFNNMILGISQRVCNYGNYGWYRILEISKKPS